MRQHIVPVCECGGRNRVRRDFESTKSSAHQVGGQGAGGQNQNGSRESEFLESPHRGLRLQSVSLGRGGAFAELLVREAEHFLPIPDGVSDRDAGSVQGKIVLTTG